MNIWHMVEMIMLVFIVLFSSKELYNFNKKKPSGDSLSVNRGSLMELYVVSQVGVCRH